MPWAGSPREHAVVQILFYFIAMVALFMIGFWFATIYKRWQATGMLVTWIAIAVVLHRAAGPDHAGRAGGRWWGSGSWPRRR